MRQSTPYSIDLSALGIGLELVPKCNLCGLEHANEYLIGSDRLHGLPGTFRIVRCAGCGLARLSPRPTADTIGAYYPASYGPFRVRPGDRGPILRRLDVSWGLVKRCRAVERFAGRRGRVLDVGCASGAFLAAMRDRGWSCAGVDTNRDAAEFARDNLGLDVWHGQVTDAGFADASFDAITLWDVLEHLHDPIGTLRALRRLLQPNGVLVASTPDLDSLGARVFGPFWLGLDIPRHLYLFNRPTLRRAMAVSGLQTERFLYFTGNYAVARMSTEAAIDALEFSPSFRQRLRQIVRFFGWRIVFLPIQAALNLAQAGSIVTLVARRG